MGVDDRMLIEPNTVAASQGWQWIVQGFALFRKNPLIWMVLFTVYFLLALSAAAIPLLGPLAVTLFAPVFTASFMLACAAVENGEDLEISHLFAGFRHNATQLISVGGIYLVGSIVIGGLAMGLGGGAMLGMMFSPAIHGDAATDAMMAGAMGGSLIAVFVALALFAPLLMAYWFAPALVIFRDLNALDAMKLSLLACWRNWASFLVYGLASLALMIVAMVPIGLGLLVLVPVMTASIYTSYRDIFPPEPEPVTPPNF